VSPAISYRVGVRNQLFIITLMLSLTALGGCGSDEAKTDTKGDAKAKERPGLKLSNDTPACQQALACCEAMVELDKGKATPEDINLSCSGVGMAADDKTCGDFKTGYSMAIESKGKPVPESCK